eukprot:Rhum_TRINITY_DN12959_c1_g1::Rhum_TRINITY_DN12959_c1_g1_i1::g.55766::m.55766
MYEACLGRCAVRCQHRSYYSTDRPPRTAALKTNPADGLTFGGDQPTSLEGHVSLTSFHRSLTKFRGDAFPAEAVLYPPCAGTVAVSGRVADLVEATCKDTNVARRQQQRRRAAQALLVEEGTLVNPSQLDSSCVVVRYAKGGATLTFRKDPTLLERWFAIVYACIDTCGADPSTWPSHVRLPGSARAQRLLVAELTSYHPVVRTLLSTHATRTRGVHALTPEHAAVVHRRLCAAVAGEAEPRCLFPFPLPLHPPHALRMRQDLADDWSRVLAAEASKGRGLERGLSLGLCVTQQCVDSLFTQATKKGLIYPAALEVGYRTFVLWVGRFCPLAGEAAVPLSAEAVEIGLSREQTEAVLAVVRGLDAGEVEYFYRLGVLLGLDFSEYYIRDRDGKEARRRLDSRGSKEERQYLAAHGFVAEDAQARLNSILDRVTNALRGGAPSVGPLTPAELAGGVRARAVPLRLPLVSEWCEYTYAEDVSLHGTLQQGAAFERAIKKRIPAAWEQCASNTGRYAGKPASLWGWVMQVHESILSVDDPALRRATLGDRGPQIEEVLRATGAVEFAKLHAVVYRVGLKRKGPDLHTSRRLGGQAGLILSRAGHLIYAAVLSALRGHKEEVTVKHLEHLEQLLGLLRDMQANTTGAQSGGVARDVVERLTAEKRAHSGDPSAELLLPEWFGEACRNAERRAYKRTRLPYVGAFPAALRDYLVRNARTPALLATEVVLRFAEEAGVPASVAQIREATRAVVESALREENGLPVPAPASTEDRRNENCWTAKRDWHYSQRDAHGFPHAHAAPFRKFLNILISGKTESTDANVRRMRSFLANDCGLCEKLSANTPPDTFRCLYECLRKIAAGQTVSVSEANEVVLAQKGSMLDKLLGRLPAWVPFDERVVAVVCHDMIKRQTPQRTSESLIRAVSATLDELRIPGGAHAIRSQRSYFIKQNAARFNRTERVQPHAWKLKAVAPSNGEFRRWLHEIVPVASHLTRSPELSTELLGQHGVRICAAVARMQLEPSRVKHLTVHQLSIIHTHLMLVMAGKLNPAQIERVERPDEVTVDASDVRRMPYVGAPSLEQVVSILDQRTSPSSRDYGVPLSAEQVAAVKINASSPINAYCQFESPAVFRDWLYAVCTDSTLALGVSGKGLRHITKKLGLNGPAVLALSDSQLASVYCLMEEHLGHVPARSTIALEEDASFPHVHPLRAEFCRAASETSESLRVSAVRGGSSKACLKTRMPYIDEGEAASAVAQELSADASMLSVEGHRTWGSEWMLALALLTAEERGVPCSTRQMAGLLRQRGLPLRLQSGRLAVAPLGTFRQWLATLADAAEGSADRSACLLQFGRHFDAQLATAQYCGLATRQSVLKASEAVVRACYKQMQDNIAAEPRNALAGARRLARMPYLGLPPAALCEAAAAFCHTESEHSGLLDVRAWPGSSAQMLRLNRLFLEAGGIAGDIDPAQAAGGVEDFRSWLLLVADHYLGENTSVPPGTADVTLGMHESQLVLALRRLRLTGGVILALSTPELERLHGVLCSAMTGAAGGRASRTPPPSMSVGESVRRRRLQQSVPDALQTEAALKGFQELSGPHFEDAASSILLSLEHALQSARFWKQTAPQMDDATRFLARRLSKLQL